VLKKYTEMTRTGRTDFKQKHKEGKMRKVNSRIFKMPLRTLRLGVLPACVLWLGVFASACLLTGGAEPSGVVNAIIRRDE